MTNHPGDPRANANGEIPFDPNENPGPHFRPPALPPQAGNADDFVPYRGQVNHGVANTRSALEHGYSNSGDLPYLSDEIAQQSYTDQTQTPRDLVPVKPVPVTVIERPDLLRRIKVVTNTFVVTNPATGLPAPILVAPADPLRRRLCINGFSSDYLLMLSTTPDALTSTAYMLSPYQPSLETTTTDAVWLTFMPQPGGTPTPDKIGAYVSAWMEAPQSNGDPLL